jgi:hypothetical protein
MLFSSIPLIPSFSVKVGPGEQLSYLNALMQYAAKVGSAVPRYGAPTHFPSSP